MDCSHKNDVHRLFLLILNKNSVANFNQFYSKRQMDWACPKVTPLQFCAILLTEYAGGLQNKIMWDTQTNMPNIFNLGSFFKLLFPQS